MTDAQREAIKEVLGQRLQQLTEMVDLTSGSMTLEIHQGKIALVEGDHHFRIRRDCSGDPPSQKVPRPSASSQAVIAWIQAELEPVAICIAGLYGEIEVKVSNGRVKDFRIVQKIKNSTRSC